MLVGSSTHTYYVVTSSPPSVLVSTRSCKQVLGSSVGRKEADGAWKIHCCAGALPAHAAAAAVVPLPRCSTHASASAASPVSAGMRRWIAEPSTACCTQVLPWPRRRQYFSPMRW